MKIPMNPEALGIYFSIQKCMKTVVDILFLFQDFIWSSLESVWAGETIGPASGEKSWT